MQAELGAYSCHFVKLKACRRKPLEIESMRWLASNPKSRRNWDELKERKVLALRTFSPQIAAGNIEVPTEKLSTRAIRPNQL
jgi:hypothetical protein